MNETVSGIRIYYKHWFDRKHLIIYFCSILIFSIIGCSKDYEGPSLGSDFLKSKYHVTLVDTFTTVFSTVLIDSIATSGQGTALVGSYNDPYMGRIRSNTYFQIRYPYNYNVIETEYFDSAVILLKFNKYTYGDLDKSYNINLYQVVQNLIYMYNQSMYLYNNSAPKIDPAPLGRLEFIPSQLNRDTLMLKIDDDFGMFLFNILKANTANPYETLDLATHYLGGLALMSDDSTDASILGFIADSSNMRLRIYSHIDIGTPEIQKNDFPLSNSKLQFNQIISDRTGTLISSLTNQKDPLLSRDSGNKAFIEGGAGIVTKVQFPGLGELMLQKDKIAIVKAELEISPAKNSYFKYKLPESLFAYETDKSNNPLNVLKDYKGYTVTGSLSLDDLYYEDTRYTIDVTSFISNEFSDNIFDYDNALLLTLKSNDLFKTTDRLVIETNSQLRNRPKLKIYIIDL